ncbi:MAG: carbohydrate binding domain-containing protein [Tepidisphaeraceae bacterium]
MSRRSCPVLMLFAVMVLCQAAWSPTQAAEEKAPANLLSNGSFNMGRQFWDLDKGGKTVATMDINADDAPPGGQSALITIGAIDSWGVQFGQKLDGGKAGKTYTFAVLARSAGDPVKIRLEIERRADPYDRAARSEETTLTKDKWTEVRVTFKVAKPFAEGWFAYLSCTQANAKFRTAMFRLYEGDHVPWQQQQRQDTALAGVSLFDTAAQSGDALSSDVLAKRDGWKQIPEDTTAHAFKGDVVLMNNRLALVLRAKGTGAEVYSIEPQGMVKRSTLRPATAGALTLAGVKIIENNPGGASVEASFNGADGKALTMGYELKMGQVFVQVNPGESISAVRVESPCRFAVMPDFFADDIVVDARSLPVAKAELPSDSFILNLLDDGQAIVMSVWNNRQDEVFVTLSGQDAARRIDATDIPCSKKDKVWVAILSAPGIWHTRDIAASDTGKIVALDWKAPMPAMWRVDLQRDDKTSDSWEMLLQRPGGDFAKPRLVGSAETLGPDRKRWTTVLGSFAYPCWIGKDNQASIQPLKSKVRFAGPAVIYPLGRASNTPLDAFTVVDIVRATLGVGPCEYILDLEGQQSQYKGRATCANRDTLNPIYEKRQQVQRKAEVERSLAEVIIFIRHIRSRIETYIAFGHDIAGYLAEQKRAHPELEKPIAELESLAGAIDARVAPRREKIKTPDEAAAMIEAFRKDGLDDTGPGAFEKCRKFTASIVEIGDNQDELAGECRLAVKILRQRAGLALAADPRLADIAREIRARSQKVLRNPAGHEGARH